MCHSGSFAKWQTGNNLLITSKSEPLYGSRRSSLLDCTYLIIMTSFITAVNCTCIILKISTCKSVESIHSTGSYDIGSYDLMVELGLQHTRALCQMSGKRDINYAQNLAWKIKLPDESKKLLFHLPGHVSEAKYSSFVATESLSYFYFNRNNTVNVGFLGVI